METMDVAVGLVGFGMGGSVFHAPLIRVTKGLRLKSIVTSRAAQVNEIPGAGAVARLEDLLADPEIGLVVVTTPSGLHFEHASAALRAGKHVVVDKPMALTAAQAGELIALAREGGRMLSAYQNRRWDGDYVAVKGAIRDGAVGEVYHFESRYDRFRMEVRPRWKEQAQPGGGTFYDLGSHIVDQALQLFGMPEGVTADIFAQRPGATADDYFHVTLHYGRKRAVLHSSTVAPKPGPHFTVHGDGGSLFTYGMDWQEETLKSGKLPGGPGWGPIGPAPYGEVFSLDGKRNELQIPDGSYQSFYAGVAEALERGSAPPVDPEDARKALVVMEAAFQSAAEGRTVQVQA